MGYRLFSKLGHVELLSTDLDASVDFFANILGMEESDRTAESVYMRCWGEFHHHSLKLTASPHSGLGHMAFRTDGPGEVDEVAELIEPTELGDGFIDGDLGHGRAYRFKTTDGHQVEAFWDVEIWQAPPELWTSQKTRPQKYVTRGAAVRRIDHVTVNCSDPVPCREQFERLGFRTNEIQRFDEGGELFSFLSVTNLQHDIGIGADPAGARGRLNHVCFWEETREEILRLADIAIDYDVEIEWGPSRHLGAEIMFLYLREPGGNRVEICSGGYLIFDPDWRPVEWLASEHPAIAWSGEIPKSMYEASPPVEEETSKAQRTDASTGVGLTAERVPRANSEIGGK